MTGTGDKARSTARRAAVLGICLSALVQACSSSGDVPSGRSSLAALESPPVVRLTASGIGPIGVGSAYSNQTFRAALPDFTFQTVKTMSEGEFKWLTAAFKNGSQQVQFEPDRSGRRIASIHVVGLEAAGPNGERLGMTYAETSGSRLDCRPGHEEWSSMAVCQTPDHVLAFVYAPSNYGGPDGALPPEAELAKARLVRIIWRAPTS